MTPWSMSAFRTVRPSRWTGLGRKRKFKLRHCQKILLFWVVLVSPPPAQHNKKFLRRFFQKAPAFLCTHFV